MRVSLATFLAVFGVLSSGCAAGSPTGIHNLQTDLPGTWSQSLDPVIPGVSRVFTLTVEDTVVRGSGTYTGEATQSGTLTVQGFISGTTAHLDITANPTLGGTPTVYHFNGQLAGPDVLSGAWWTTSDPVTVTFTRVFP